MIKRFLIARETLLLGVILLLIALVASRFPGFVSAGNLVNVFNDTAPLIILALGQMVVIVTRCIDLSVAGNLALTGMAVAMLNSVAPGLPIPIILTISILLGAGMGLMNGLLVWKLEIPPIVVTLGTMTIFRGIIFLISDGKWVNAHEMSASFTGFPRAETMGLPVMSWIAIGVSLMFLLLITRTSLGRAFFAVGGNPHAAVYTGINVGKTQCAAFVISGALAGLVGYLWVARYAVAYVDIAGGFELEVVAACVIGGISIAGGLGSVGGAVLGALFLGVVKNALPVVHISPFWQLAISGAAIVIAVTFNARSNRSSGRVILKPARSNS
ncbi:ABC transporter permease [Candidatus Njordibacter sp. Uisw_056]|jgi:rhamnose transport system permease protein|uniref:ABC transporter permease n=1 Tax=Candidatus Njordibacter sp. Uisw_056 TaxID=3230973 RepID=UPI003D572EBE|tara:strand:- start:89 stop:1072 length:984 start_codon:yes stop_codon:yes gene_type:complete